MYRIMIVEDDPTIAEMLSSHLQSWGMETCAVKDFQNVLACFAKSSPHLILMDISLPFFNGYHWCGEIRKVSKVPVIFVSSAGDNMNIIMAMNMGGDDFITKPFDLDVLVAKIQALLRRAYDFQGSADIMEYRGAVLNLGDTTLTFGDQTLELTRNEFRILKTLLEHKGSVVARETIMKRLWNDECFIDDNTLTVNINRLRRKLEEAGLKDAIQTKKGIGYLMGD